MCGALLIIGLESVSSKILNKEYLEVSKILAEAGYPLKKILFLEKDPSFLKRELFSLWKEYSYIIVISNIFGGQDGLTIKDLAQSLSLSPKDFTGYYLKKEKKFLFFLDFWLKPEFIKNKVIPLLQKDLPSKERIYLKTLKVFGLLEKEIKDRLKKIEKTSSLKIIYCLKLPEIHINLSLKGLKQEKKQLKKLTQKIKTLLEPYVFAEDDMLLEEIVGQLLRKRKETLAIAESCTGGLISSRITQIPGSSIYFEEGVVTYSNQAKNKILGVPQEILKKYGAVSKETALAMAKGIRNLAQTTYGLSVTGIAGPTGGSKEKPVGTVWIGFSCKKATVAQGFLFPGDRHLIQNFAATSALDWLRRYLIYDTLLPSYSFKRTG